MPYELNLPRLLKRAGWKVKIRDKERLEPPHVTILLGMKAWRLDLRTREFLDRGDSWSQIDDGVRNAIETNWKTLQHEWDQRYPENPIGEDDDD